MGDNKVKNSAVNQHVDTWYKFTLKTPLCLIDMANISEEKHLNVYIFSQNCDSYLICRGQG